MPPTVLTYPKTTGLNKVKRLGERGRYDTLTIHTIVNNTPILHVSFTDLPPSSSSDSPSDSPPPIPFILPMLGRLGSYTHPSSSLSDPLDLYLHGYVSSRFITLSRSLTPSGGLPVSICATKLDGIVLALTPNNHSFNYRSAILFGKATIIEDVSEKLYAMELITNGVISGRWEASRVPPDNVEMASTTIVKVKIESASAKLRVGEPGDETKDLERNDVVERVWTGVLPVYEMVGEPVQSSYNKVTGVPGYIENFVKERNEREQKYAEEAIRMEKIKRAAGGEN